MFEGSSPSPTTMKLPLPAKGEPKLFIHVAHCGAGPVGSRWGNPATGWQVSIGSNSLSPVLKSTRTAKEWAEERYNVGWWYKPPGDGSPYHSQYAVAKNEEFSWS